MLLKVKNSVFEWRKSLGNAAQKSYENASSYLPRFCALVTNLSTMDSHAVLSCKGKKMENSPYFLVILFTDTRRLPHFVHKRGETISSELNFVS